MSNGVSVTEEKSSMLHKGIQFAIQATELDKSRKYTEALKSYESTIEHLEHAIKFEATSEKSKDAIHVKLLQYKARAKKIADYLKSDKQTILLTATRQVAAAIERDRQGNYVEALELYKSAVESFELFIEDRTSEAVNDVVRAKCLEYTQRMELIEAYLQRSHHNRCIFRG